MATFRNSRIQITEDADKIYIKDNLKFSRIAFIIAAICWILYSVMNLNKINFDLKQGWFYYFVLIIWIASAVMYFRMDVSSEISKKKISKLFVRKNILGKSSIQIWHEGKKRNLGVFNELETETLKNLFREILA